MIEIIWFYLLCWIIGGVLLLSAILNCKISHIRYLSSSKPGEMISRIMTGSFGIVVIGLGLLLYLASYKN